MTSGLRIKQRAIGARASIERFGHVRIVSETGGTLELSASASLPGFDPLDLLFSSLAGCLGVSTRIAASRLGLVDRFETATVRVTGEKNAEEPFRILRINVEIAIEGDLVEGEKRQIAALAEEICTVSNTLKSLPDISVKLA